MSWVDLFVNLINLYVDSSILFLGVVLIMLSIAGCVITVMLIILKLKERVK